MPRKKKEDEPSAKMDPISQTLKWVLAGATERDIKEAIAATFPGKDAPALLAAVMGDLERSAACSPDILIGWCFEATRDLYRRMVEIGDFPGALRAVKQIAELTRHVHQPETQAEQEPE